MGAKQSESRMFTSPPEAIQAALVPVLQSLAAQEVVWSADGWRVTCKAGMTLQSWGERLEIAIGGSGEVWVQSQCLMPTQVIDWGKNAENCRRVLDGIAMQLSGGTPVQTGIPAGWHPDPSGRHSQRYWNGAAWTDDVADNGATGKDPLP